jgi:predicted anti-sigma-YlaC factor YlaD
MQVLPASCERSREWVSLRLDGQLSTFEAALLDRHLRRCPACSAFAAGVATQTQLLRAAALEQPRRRFELPARPARTARRSLVGAFGAVAAAAVAAVVLLSPSSNNATKDSSRGGAAANAGTQLVVFTAQPSLTANFDVPRLRVEPASFADGPVHGLYSMPMTT